MKRIVRLLLPVIIFVSACKNKNEFTIQGKIENAGTINKVLLYEEDQLVDSAFINDDSQFKFTRTSSIPNFYTLAVGEKIFTVIAKNGEELEFSANYVNTKNNYKINGSEESEIIREFSGIENKYGDIFLKTQNKYSHLATINPGAEDSLYKAFILEQDKNVADYSAEALKFAEKNKNNLAGFYATKAIRGKFITKYEDPLIRYADEIRSKFPGNKSVQAFVNRMTEIKPLSAGKKAPDFELPSPEGKLIKLSDFKGKYLLLDFWASWCVPCRRENPNIVKQYTAFKDKNFTVLGISLDKDQTDWLKAIDDDKLAWTHGSELKEWDGNIVKLYKLDAIPASFLLDPDGKIIAKNLTGEDLKEFLNKTIK